MSDLLTLNIPFDPFIDFINLNKFSLSRLTFLPQWSIPPMLKIAEIDAMFWYHVVEKWSIKKNFRHRDKYVEWVMLILLGLALHH